MADVLTITPHTRIPLTEITPYDETIHKVPYKLKIRIRLISLFEDTEYNKSLGVLHGPIEGHDWSPTNPGQFYVELDEEQDSDDSDGSVVPGGGEKLLVYGKNFEVVGKVEQRKGEESEKSEKRRAKREERGGKGETGRANALVKRQDK